MARYTIRLIDPEDFVLNARWLVEDSEGVRTPVDASSYEAILSFYDASRRKLDADISGTTDEDGYINVSIPGDEIADVPASAKRYKLRVTGPASKVLLVGSIVRL